MSDQHGKASKPQPPEEAACRGGVTIPQDGFCEHMNECAVCGVAVRWDLADHGFFGFKSACGFAALQKAEGEK